MAELRKDYLRNRWVIIVPERSKRPQEYKKAIEPESEEVRKNCFFCAGNEHLTPPEVMRVEKKGNKMSLSFSVNNQQYIPLKETEDSSFSKGYVGIFSRGSYLINSVEVKE